jgi:hypothetical protein
MSICIPASVEEVYGSNLPYRGLAAIELESGNEFFLIRDHCLTDLNDRRIIRYFGRDSEIEIPNSATRLDDYSFCHCSSIRKVVFEPNCRLCWLSHWNHPR